MLGFLHRHLPDFPAFFQPIAASIQPAHYTLAIWMLNGLTLPLTWCASKRMQYQRTHQWISLFAVFMGINALMHLCQCLIFMSLAPGAVTAAFLILPISLMLIRHEHARGFLSKKRLIVYLWVSILTMPLIIGAILSFSGWILSQGNLLK